MSNPNIVLIAAVYADTLGIGYKGKLPWTLHKEDLREFKNNSRFTHYHGSSDLGVYWV